MKRIAELEQSIIEYDNKIQSAIQQDPSLIPKLFESGDVHLLYALEGEFIYLNEDKSWKSKLILFEEGVRDKFKAYAEPYSKLPLHNHRQEEVIEVISGQFEVCTYELIDDRYVYDDARILSAGETMVIKPFLHHAIQEVAGQLSVLLVEFQPPLTKR